MEVLLIKYTKRYINLVSIIIAIIIVSLTSFGINKIKNNTKSKQVEEISVNNETVIDEIKEKEEKEEEVVADVEWNIKIPKIELDAPILEGTSSEVMDEYVAHFSETSKKDGNVGLIAHNRGFPINYFARLKELVVGDKVIYTCNDFNKEYIVSDVGIIENTNWSLLETTSENTLTLITCVENEPEYRRYVQAIEYTNIIP